MVRCFLEYLITELFEIIGIYTRNIGKNRITNNIIRESVTKDNDINKMFSILSISLPIISRKSRSRRSRKTRSRRSRKSRSRRNRISRKSRRRNIK